MSWFKKLNRGYNIGGTEDIEGDLRKSVSGLGEIEIEMEEETFTIKSIAAEIIEEEGDGADDSVDISE